MRQRIKRMICGIVSGAITMSCFALQPSYDAQAAKTTMLSEPSLAMQNTSLFRATVDTEYDLVSANTSTYRILIPADASVTERFAANELQTFFEEATKVKLPIVKEYEGISTEKVLSVGQTKAAQNQQVIPSYDTVLSNGFVLKTVGDSCYITGYEDMGTRNGVYEWLRECFDYECYAPDCVKISQTDTRKLPLLNLTKVPDFEYRQGSGEVAMNTTAAYRMQYNSNAELFATGFSCHNSFDFIDPEGAYDWKSDTYKSWYSEATHKNNQRGQRVLPAQLCYSNQEMWSSYVKNLKARLNDCTESSMLIGMEDNNLWCTCSNCTASKTKYGTNAATIIKFANYVQEEINAWCDKQGRERIQLVIFAYHQCEQPPVTYDTTKNQYVPIDDSVKLHENLGVMYAPVNASYAYSFEESINAAYKTQIDGWSAMTDQLYAWTYDMYATEAFVFLDTFDVVQKNCQYLHQRGFKFIYNQLSAFNENGNPGWERAKNYVFSRLVWDVNASVETLLDDFFTNYYEDAASIMKNLMKENSDYLDQNVLSKLKVEAPTEDNYATVKGNIFVPILDNYGRQSFTTIYLEGALKKIETAYTAIEKYKYTEPEHYQKLKSRIMLESLQFQYILSRFVKDPTSYSKTQKDYRWQLRADMEALGVKSVKENWMSGELWNSMWEMPAYNQVQISFAEMTTNGQIYLKAEIVDGTDKDKTISEAYGNWNSSYLGKGEIQFVQDGKLITENMNWNFFVTDSNHADASIYVECPTSYIKDNIASITGFTIKAGTVLIIGDATPIQIANDVQIGKVSDSWSACNEVELSYTQTINGKLYFHGNIIAGPDKGKTISDVYGDWSYVAEGKISYVKNEEACQTQAQWCLYADNPGDYNSNLLLQDNTIIKEYGSISALSVEAGTVLSVPDTNLAPIKIANDISLVKDASGEWAMDCNTVELFYAGTNGSGIYLDAWIVDGPDSGRALHEVYGDWKMTPRGDMTYYIGSDSATEKVIWSPNCYNATGNLYLSGDFSRKLSSITKVEIAEGTKIVPVDCSYTLTPIVVGNSVMLTKNANGGFDSDRDTLRIKVQDSTCVADAGADSYDMRLLASVASLRYQSVGFVVSKENINPTVEGRDSQVLATTKVYRSINDVEVNREWSAKELYGTNASYLITWTLWNMPANTRYYVRAFKQQMDGTIVYGSVRTLDAPQEK